MRRLLFVISALLVLGTYYGTSLAGYHVKAVMEGGWLDIGPSNLNSSWPDAGRTIEMDGDTSAQELVIHEPGGRIGIGNLSTGAVTWISTDEVVWQPDQIYQVVPTYQYFYRDADGDGLLDVILNGCAFNPVRCGVAVIGWVNESDAPAPGVEITPSRAFPNPNTGQCEVRFSLPSAGQVAVAVFDATGRRIRQVLDGHLPAGSYSPVWDGRDDAGLEVPSGVYFAKITTPAGEQTAKLVLAR